MDTITAPELLEKFQAVEGAEEIEIDVEKMTYVSSAGLRVLFMMYKSLEDKSRFKLVRVNNSVKEILEVTGFDQFLL
jgi:anti-anti-sigma factor